MSTDTKANERKRVLLVDDDEDFLMQNAVRLTNAGFDVIKASTQSEAIQAFEASNPQVIILDLMMEEKDAGMVLAHKFKKAAPSTPVIMVTGIARDTGMSLNRSTVDSSWLKADRVLAKPIRVEQLVREIEMLLAH